LALAGVDDLARGLRLGPGVKDIGSAIRAELESDAKE